MSDLAALKKRVILIRNFISPPAESAARKHMFMLKPGMYVSEYGISLESRDRIAVAKVVRPGSGKDGWIAETPFAERPQKTLCRLRYESVSSA